MRFEARLRSKSVRSNSLYESVGYAKALIMGASGHTEASSVFDTKNNVVVAVYTDDANGPKLHKLDTWPKDVAEADWMRIMLMATDEA